MPDLVALAMPAGPLFVEGLIEIWEHGDAVLPLDPNMPAPALDSLLHAMRPARVIDGSGEIHRLEQSIPLEPGDALVMPTSGSTGIPRGVVHTHSSIGTSAQASNAALAVDPSSDRWLCCLPVSHIGGFSVITRSLLSATPLEVHPRFDAEAVARSVHESGTTLTSLVPTALARIDPAPFRKIVVGGSAMPAVMPANAVASYGLTETGSAIAYDGVALQGVEIEIRDGEITIRAPMVARAYRDATTLLDEHGWLRTGDAGELDDEGRLVVHGRIDDMINTGGEKVWPQVVEDVLRTHPDVREAAVIGRSDPEWGQTVVAVVVATDPADPPTLDMLRHHVKASLPSYAAPKILELADKLPRTRLGKVRRSALRRSP